MLNLSFLRHTCPGLSFPNFATLDFTGPCMACKQIAAVLVLSLLVEGKGVPQNSGGLRTNKNAPLPSTWLVYHGYLWDVNRQMIKAYVYSDQELMRAFGFSPEQLERARIRIAPEFEPTADAGTADFFWCMADLGHVEAYLGGVSAIKRGAERLSHWAGNEGRHVFYFCSDGPNPVDISSIMFRQSFYKDRRDDWAIAWPYAVDDFRDIAHADFDKLSYDVSFVGSRVSHKCRIESFDSVKATPEIRSFLDDSGLHWGKVENTAIGKKRREIFIKSLAESKLVLAARGGGLSSYRFFEAMSAGRIPVLLADDWELPHQDLIHWDWCIVQIPEKDAKNAGPILRDFLSKTDNRKLAEMGTYGRGVWQSYLAPEIWPDMMTWYIERLLK